MIDLAQLAKRLREGNLSVVAANGGVIRESDKKGIAPIMEFLKEEPQFLKNALVADKVVGKAAAMLFVYGGVKELYALTISEPALEYLTAENFTVKYDKKVKNIINREGADICPMEKAVLNISDCKTAYSVLLDTLAALRAKNS